MISLALRGKDWSVTAAPEKPERRKSGAEARASLATTSGEYGTTTTGCLAGTETVSSSALELAGLIRSFHVGSTRWQHPAALLIREPPSLVCSIVLV